MFLHPLLLALVPTNDRALTYRMAEVDWAARLDAAQARLVELQAELDARDAMQQVCVLQQLQRPSNSKAYRWAEAV